MSRSVKKGPFVAFSLLKKIDAMNASEEKKIIKTWKETRAGVYHRRHGWP